MRLRLVLSETLQSLSTNASTTVATTLTVLIGMFLLGLFIAIGSWVVSLTDHVQRDLLVKVFFLDEATPEEINAVGNRLESFAEVEEITFVSKDEALARMQERHPELTAHLATNPLPRAFEVKPRDAEGVELVVERLTPLPAGVDEVEYAEETTRHIRHLVSVVEFMFLAASVILLVASTILIANTIRLSIFARRREIEVMKLVGASNWFVRGPFMLEGLIHGFLGAAAAVVLLFLAKEFVLPLFDQLLSMGGDVRAWSFEVIALILIGVGLVLGAAGSGITIRRFLRV